MPESIFFEKYTPAEYTIKDSNVLEYKQLYNKIKEEILELPLSNTWIAQQTSHKIPSNSVVHLGILNTLRNWNFFEFTLGVKTSSNVGGFGIDGNISSLIGASLSNKDKLYFLVVGDLAFFYDLNSLGNRHIGNNIRILLVNNGKGTEFRNSAHPCAAFGNEADGYMAAAGHFGNKSPQLVKHYAEDLGFEYLTASTKEEFLLQVDRFVAPVLTDKPMVFEVFTNHEDESLALEMMQNIVKLEKMDILKRKAKTAIRLGLNLLKGE